MQHVIKIFARKHLGLLCAAAALLGVSAPGMAQTPSQTPSFEVVQHKAFDFFWKESNPKTGLTKDRATNFGDKPDAHTIGSIAATGYALAALPIGVSHHWITPKAGYARALTTLRFLDTKLPEKHGFYYHFVDWRTGARIWKCELSSIDTALLVLGALTAGNYWHGTEVQRLAEAINARLDWPWMQKAGGDSPGTLSLSMGWHPETGWINNRWRGYSEASYLYWLAMGSPTHALTPAAWDQWNVKPGTVEGYSVLGGPDPIFMAQMAPAYFDIRGLRDRQGRDWWESFQNANLADHAYCTRNPEKRKTYAEGFWGINACDQPPPVGYGAQEPTEGQNDGTVAPTAMLASLPFAPTLAHQALGLLWTKKDKIWGRYGFSNAFNVDKNWYDTDVLGIDLGMMLLNVENARTGLVWRLLRQDPVIRKGMKAAGFRPQRHISRSQVRRRTF